jgi:hypothetical protein
MSDLLLNSASCQQTVGGHCVLFDARSCGCHRWALREPSNSIWWFAIITIGQLFHATSDFSIVDIKPLLSFLDPDRVSQFLKLVDPLADLPTLLNSVDLFTNPAHVSAVFDAIRSRSLIDVMAHGRSKSSGRPS